MSGPEHPQGPGAAPPEDRVDAPVRAKKRWRVWLARLLAGLHISWPGNDVAPAALLRTLWSRANELLLRAYLRAFPSEQNRTLILTIAIGALCGLAAVLFHLSIGFAERHLIDRALSAPSWWWIPWTIVTPVLGAIACGVLLQYVIPAARGSGIPQVKVVFAMRSGRIRFRDAVGKFFIGVLQIGTGSSLGREGPTVYICAGIASGLGRLFAVSPQSLRRLIPVGAAAGIAAAFNAPIAAVTFTIEELVGELDQTVLSGVVVAAALAAIIERTVLGEQPVFAIAQHYSVLHPSSLLVFLALGVAAASVAHVFVRGLLFLRGRFQRMTTLPGWAKPAVGALVTGVIAAIALGTLDARGVTGGGYQTLSAALSGNLPARVLFALCAMKIVSTLFSYSSGGAGGIFAPTLFVGGMLGGAFGYIDRWALGHPDTQTGAFALVGMGAVFAGVIRAPITSILIIFEMTDGYGLILPLMLANSTAYVLARRWHPKPIYEALIEQDGIQLPHKSSAGAALAALRVRQAMTSADLKTAPADMTIRAAVDRLNAYRFSAYPVLDGGGRLVGLVGKAKLRRLLAEGLGDERLHQHLKPREYLTPEQPLLDAVVRMNRLGVRQMAVVDTDDPGRLAGMFAMSDIMRAHAHAALDAEGAPVEPADGAVMVNGSQGAGP